MVFGYFYYLKAGVEVQPGLLFSHMSHWARAEGRYSGGPFRNQEGGFVAFEAPNLAKAKTLAEEDPLQGMVEVSWVKPWDALNEIYWDDKYK